MNKNVVLTIFGLLFLGVVFTVLNIKNAYKVIPINANKEVNPAPYSNWLEFIPDSKQFKVQFPAYAQSAQETNTIPSSDKKRLYKMYVSQMLNNTIFMVTQINYPANYTFSSPKDILHDVVNELLQGNASNRLKSGSDTTFLDLPAYDFEITGSNYNISGKAFLKDKSVYLLTYIAKSSDFNLDEYNHFIDSFELTENKSP